MQIVQGILCFIEIKLRHNIKTALSLNNMSFFQFITKQMIKLKTKYTLRKNCCEIRLLLNLDTLDSKFTVTVQSIGSFPNLKSE